jgi:hypothetical protein
MEMGVRFYDPRIGRFISREPLRADFAGETPRLYAYVENNPLRFTDPSGLGENADCHSGCTLRILAADVIVGGLCGAATGNVMLGLAGAAAAHAKMEKDTAACHKNCDEQYPVLKTTYIPPPVHLTVD